MRYGCWWWGTRFAAGIGEGAILGVAEPFTHMGRKKEAGSVRRREARERKRNRRSRWSGNRQQMTHSMKVYARGIEDHTGLVCVGPTNHKPCLLPFGQWAVAHQKLC